MDMIANGLIFLVALHHAGFLVLEMFLWQKPQGRKVFRLSAADAATTAVLAANQGLYNGFLSAGLLLGMFAQNWTLIIFILCCVIIAGLYGAWSVSHRIFFVQSLPAILALLFILI